MSDAEQYAGEVEVVDGMLQLPEKYARARQFVVRQRTITQDVRSGKAIDEVGWRDDPDRGVNNEHLDEDEVLLKVYGEREELYHVNLEDQGGADE